MTEGGDIMDLIADIMEIEVKTEKDADTLRRTVDFIEAIINYNERLKKSMSAIGYVPVSEVVKRD